MKKLSFAISLIVAAIITACTADIDSGSTPAGSSEIIAYTDTDISTRTSLGGDLDSGLEVFWSEGDQILINNTHTYTLASGAGTTKGKFTGEGVTFEAGMNYTAVYPAHIYTPYFNSYFWPETQDGSGSAPMIAKGTATGTVMPGLYFNNLGGLLRLNLNFDEAITVSSITVTANEPLSGIIYFKEIDGAQTAVINTDDPMYYDNYITVNCDSGVTVSKGNPKDIFFAIPAGKYSNFTVTITDKDSKAYVYKLTKDLVIERSKVATAAIRREADYLCFTAEEANSTISMAVVGTTSWTYPTLEYSKDLETWTPFEIGTTTVTLDNVGDMVYFRGDNEKFSNSQYDWVRFVMTGRIASSGNIMSLLDKTCKETTLPYNAFRGLFGECSSLTSAPKLPATKLGNSCYAEMFWGCTSLTTAPALPATDLDSWCYNEMFYNCTSLATAPELPATTLKGMCYYEMFRGCTGLTTAPVLPATTLADKCYERMFFDCTSLTAAPALPATTLRDQCYEGMFYGCTSLTTAPALPATKLGYSCYAEMFYGCTSLVTTPALLATTLAVQCYYAMFEGCTGLKTASALPATTLESKCYYKMFYWCTGLTTAPTILATTFAESSCYQMFYNCTSLTTVPDLVASTLAEKCCREMFHFCTSLTVAPALPATTLADYCYYGMFENCTKLTTAPALPAATLAKMCYSRMFYYCQALVNAPLLPATTLVSGCYSDMFSNSGVNNVTVYFTEWLEGATSGWLFYVKSNGTFTCPAGLDTSTNDTSHVPSGWNVVNL